MTTYFIFFFLSSFLRIFCLIITFLFSYWWPFNFNLHFSFTVTRVLRTITRNCAFCLVVLFPLHAHTHSPHSGGQPENQYMDIQCSRFLRACFQLPRADQYHTTAKCGEIIIIFHYVFDVFRVELLFDYFIFPFLVLTTKSFAATNSRKFLLFLHSQGFRQRLISVMKFLVSNFLDFGELPLGDFDLAHFRADVTSVAPIPWRGAPVCKHHTLD